MPTWKRHIVGLSVLMLLSGVGALPAERITPARVVKDLRAHLKLPADKKLVRVAYVGKTRNFTERDGEIPVPHRALTTAVDVTHVPCGLISRETWEVHYYQSGEHWSYRRIVFTAEREIAKPKKKIPVLDDAPARELVMRDLAERDPGVTVRECVITDKKPSRKFCVPAYALQVRAMIRRGDGLGQTANDYECRLRYLVRREGDGWKVIEQSCLTDGAKPRDVPCYYDTNCRKAGTVSELPPVSADEALRLLQAELAGQYGLVRDGAEIVECRVVRQLPVDGNGTVLPFILAARLIITERVPVTGEEGTAYRTARAIYDCTVEARLTYDFSARRWVPQIINCCAGDEACDNSCSTPARACRRIGER